MMPESQLIDASRRVILRWQQPGGAYPACPNMPDYQYSWFRDGSFIAHAMLISGEAASADAFHNWAAQTILRYESGARRAMDEVILGRTSASQDILRARYTYDGNKGSDDWPEFQLDGLGTWLWSLEQFASAGQPLNAAVRAAAQLVAQYLTVLGLLPCNDLWEEFGDKVHTYTLAAIARGLRSAAILFEREEWREAARKIQIAIAYRCVAGPLGEESFVKYVGDSRVDASLVALATPYEVAAPDDPLMRRTVERIERDLYVKNTGMHRYLGDTYYGGGAWPLLAAWLGWYEARRGCFDKAREILSGILRLATPTGDLPEQVAPPMLADVSYYDHWVRVRGPIATPLLWSHAMVLILAHAISAGGGQ